MKARDDSPIDVIELLAWHLNINLGKWKHLYGLVKDPNRSLKYQGHDTTSLLRPLDLAKDLMGPFCVSCPRVERRERNFW